MPHPRFWTPIPLRSIRASGRRSSWRIWNWIPALCGTTPDLHGVRDNTPKPGVSPAVATARGNHPCIFSEIRRQEPNAYTCSLYDWNGIGWYHDSASANYTKFYPSNFESESQYTDEFIELLKKNCPRLAFITYDMCDHTGHAKRYDSPEYADACAEVDKFIGRIADHVAANMAKDTAIVLFSDHGGHDNGHGDTTLECYEIPFLVHAPGLEGYVFREPVTISDVAPTVAGLLGLKLPDFWRGRFALRRSAKYPLQKRLVVHAGKGNGAPKNMLFISFDREICRALRKALPKYEVLWITLSHKDLERKDDNKGPAIAADELIAFLKDANLSGVDMHGDLSVVTEEYVKKVKAAGFKFGVWTVDDTRNARILLERGVDAVTTNRSKEIAEELKDWK